MEQNEIKPGVNTTKFLILLLVLSIPFYIWGALSPVAGLPFGLPISFLMIFIPFFLSLWAAWTNNGSKGISKLFQGIIDYGRAKPWAIIAGAVCLPVVGLLSYLTMRVLGITSPEKSIVPLSGIPLMFILYFLGAIPEEFGWIATLSEPMVNKYGLIKSGMLLGGVWAIWHVIPWSWKYSGWWIIGMCLFNILIRIAMLYLYMHGGKSLFVALIFHMMINVVIGCLPNSSANSATWIMSFWMLIFLLLVMYMEIKNARLGKILENLKT